MFDVNKPEEYQDQKTGEMVTKFKVPQKMLTEVEGVIGAHNQKMNQLVMNARNVFQLLDMTITLNREVTKADKNIQLKIVQTVKRMRLDKAMNWGYNLQEKCMEARRPPQVKPGVAPPSTVPGQQGPGPK